MSKRIGIACLLLGILCLLSAVGLMVYNRFEAESAAKATDSLLAEVQDAMKEQEAASAKGPTIEVGGYECLGVLSIPALELKLPVLAGWSEAKLKVAPCCYYGSYDGPNFVIAAHNYAAHFARLSELQEGDLITFTDAGGKARGYEVVLLETLPKTATEAMITAGFDLSLYTCTVGGGSRVTVRCRLI